VNFQRMHTSVSNVIANDGDKHICMYLEVGNLAGKAIALSHYELEKRRVAAPTTTLLIEEMRQP
jgi:hypothetical protein